MSIYYSFNTIYFFLNISVFGDIYGDSKLLQLGNGKAQV